MCIVPRMIDVQKKWHCPHYWKSSQDNSGLTQTFDFHSLASVVWERKFRTRAVLEALDPRALTYYNGFPTQILISRYFSGREAESLAYFLGANIIMLELFLADWVVLSFEINLLSCGEQSSQNVFSCLLEARYNCWLRRICSSWKAVKEEFSLPQEQKTCSATLFFCLAGEQELRCGGYSLSHVIMWGNVIMRSALLDC